MNLEIPCFAELSQIFPHADGMPNAIGG